jgi:hypothetical protein
VSEGGATFLLSSTTLEAVLLNHDLYLDDLPGMSSRTKEILSWMTIAECLLLAKVRLKIRESYPGGGQYNCLGLVDEGENDVILLNRLGTSALVGGKVITEIWKLAGDTVGEGPCSLAILLLSKSWISSVKRSFVNLDAATAAINIANWLLFNSEEDVTAEPVWKTLGEDTVVHTESFALKFDGNVIATVDTQTGVALDTAGKLWNGWPAIQYHPDGKPGAHIGFEITAFSQGQVVSHIIVPPAKVRLSRKLLLEEHLSPVLVVPVFRVAPGFNLNPRASQHTSN